ncbi:MAG: serine hydrolase [Bacteroidota bacterium]
MKHLFFSIALCLFTLIACTQNQKHQDIDPRLEGLKAEIDSMLKEHYAAGLAVAIIERGEILYAQGHGFRDFENKLPVDEHTVFGIGSCSKAFTAAALGILESQGQLSFSDKPSSFLPELKFNTEGMNDSITIAHLLKHNTGLSATPSECIAVLFGGSNKYEVLPKIQHVAPSAPVGEAFIYNNLLYSVAGMVLEKASGKSLEDNWQSLLFDPLEMSNTYTHVNEAAEAQNFSFAYAVDSILPGRVMPEDMTVRGAGGGIYSSVSDMAKWMQMWMDDGVYKGNQVLAQSYIDEARDTLVLLPNNPIDSIPVRRHYGYGWGNWDHKGYFRSEHSGGASGYVSNVVMYPNEKVGIVVLSNQTTTSLPSRVNNRIVERLYPSLKERPLDVRFGNVFNIAPMDTPSIPDTIPAPDYALEDLIGKYSHPGFGEVEVSYIGQTLYADFPFTKFRLEYVGGDIFYDYFTEEVPQAYWNFLEFQFERSEQNTTEGLWINVDTEPILFRKKETN